MKKKFLSLLTPVLCMLMIWVINVNAVENHPVRLVDEADVLTETEETELLFQLDEISERQKMDVIVVTINTLNGEEIPDFASDYYDYNGYGMGENHDGIMFLISMEEREWYILTTGYGIEVLSDSDIDDTGERVASYLSEGDYAEGFGVFAETCDTEVTYANENVSEESSPSIFLSLIIGLVLGFVPALIIRGKLKSVHMQSSAGRYEKTDTRKITVKEDIFLYHTINRVPKPKDDGGSSTFSGSSGRSHGGGGGSF